MGVTIADDWPAEAGTDPDDAFEAANNHARLVSKKASELRVLDDARALIRAEKVTGTNFDAQYLDRTQLLELAAPDPLIAGVLPRHGYVILRGRDHSFKSFVAIDWALCLATGKRWQDHAVEQVPVLYIVGEGAYGLRARVDAWEYAWGHKIPADMFTVRTTAVNMHQPGPAFDHLLQHVRARRYGLVVVDTLRRVSGAADGNSSEMGLVVDNLDLVKQATDHGTILTVAHTDKGDHDTRGYSGIEDDADVVWAARRDDMYLDLELTKFKDGPDGRRLHLVASPSLNSLTLSATGALKQVDTTETQAAILEALRIMPDGGHTGPELMAVAGLGKSSFYRALDALLETGHIAIEKHGRTRYYGLPGLDLEPATEPDDRASESTPDDPTLDPQTEAETP